MIFHFKTSDVTFFKEDQSYFEEKISNLKKFFRKKDSENPDVIDVHVKIKKNKHHTGERFECNTTIFCPTHGKFHAEVTEDNIKKCADKIYEKLTVQTKKFQNKN